MFARAICVSLAKCGLDGTGTSDNEPCHCIELYSGNPSDFFGLPGVNPLRFATQRSLSFLSYTMAAGNQPTGISPTNFEWPGLNWTTPMAFCVPLHTKRVLPEESKVSASGCAPNKSPGSCRIHIVST